MGRRTWRAALAGASALVSLGAAAAAPPPAQVMIVADFHMSNPGRDLTNMQVDDVLAPTRQAEITRVTAALLRFRPTVVAAEWPAEVAEKQYAAYLGGTLKPSRNEVVQLGFRLAKAAGLQHFTGIDVEGDFPFEPVGAYAAAHPGASEPVDGIMAFAKANVAEQTRTLKEKGIAATLRLVNTPTRIAADQAQYRALVRVGGRSEQPGAALLAAWYARNLQICARLVQALKPGDRAVVFYGSGHAFLLRECAAQTPGLALVEANAWLPR